MQILNSKLGITLCVSVTSATILTAKLFSQGWLLVLKVCKFKILSLLNWLAL